MSNLSAIKMRSGLNSREKARTPTYTYNEYEA